MIIVLYIRYFERKISMLSFENVLDCFALVIQTGICEVLLTRHGYVVMEWDEEEREWFNVTHCDTPEALREAILSAYEGYLQLALVTDCHNPTEEEIRTIQKRSADLRLLCNAHGKMTII